MDIKYKMVGMFSNDYSGTPSDCVQCHDAKWGSILINGVCGECLYEAWLESTEEESIFRCEFYGCHGQAVYMGWFRELDFAGQPSGLMKKIMVCEEHKKHLIGYEPAESEDA